MLPTDGQIFSRTLFENHWFKGLDHENSNIEIMKVKIFKLKSVKD